MHDNMTLAELEDNFSFFEGWEDKYAYIIDLGKKIDGVEEVYKIDTYKVQGCTSNVWLVAKMDGDIITFKADSDAMIVRGLIAILMIAYNGKSRDEVQAINISEFFEAVGLDQHLSPNRRNGFFSIVERIKNL